LAATNGADTIAASGRSISGGPSEKAWPTPIGPGTSPSTCGPASRTASRSTRWWARACPGARARRRRPGTT